MIRMGDRLKQNQLFALALYITVTKNMIQIIGDITVSYILYVLNSQNRKLLNVIKRCRKIQ